MYEFVRKLYSFDFLTIKGEKQYILYLTLLCEQSLYHLYNKTRHLYMYMLPTDFFVDTQGWPRGVIGKKNSIFYTFFFRIFFSNFFPRATPGSYSYILLGIAGETAGLIGLTFFVDTHGGPGSVVSYTKFETFFFKIKIFLITGNARPFR